MEIKTETHNGVSSPLAGGFFYLNDTAADPMRGMVVPGAVYVIEDWWDVLTGGSWMTADGNFAALHYAMRTGMLHNIPFDNEVYYGHIGGLGHLVHASEIGERLTPDQQKEALAR